MENGNLSSNSFFLFRIMHIGLKLNSILLFRWKAQDLKIFV